MSRRLSVLLLALLALSCLSLACSRGGDKPTFKTEYQAVFLDNGQVFFGKIENAGSDYPLLRDVFYVQSQVNPQTKEQKNVLIKRGNEWHKPDSMYINSRHVVIIEPVSPDSRVALLIKEAKAQKEDGKP